MQHVGSNGEGKSAVATRINEFYFLIDGRSQKKKKIEVMLTELSEHDWLCPCVVQSA